MSKQKKVVKKVVVGTERSSSSKAKLKPTMSKSRQGSKAEAKMPLIFGWANYRIMLLGILIITLGMLLMMGGSMPSPDVWDESLIYSFRRTTLAPFLIVAGFCVEVYAIFKK
jgi:hypothetical protein